MVLGLSSLLGPLLCLGWSRVTRLLNTVVAGYGPLVEICAYTGMSFVLLSVARIIGRSISSAVFIICGLLRRLAGGRETWVSETLAKFAGPLARSATALLTFLAANSLINTIPQTAVWEVPRSLRFCDLDGDGFLEAAELEQVFYRLSLMPLGGYVVLQTALLLLDLRRPPSTLVPDSARDPLGAYLRGLQRLHGQARSRRVPVKRRYILLRVVDMFVVGIIWLSAFTAWVFILGVPFRAVLATLAPLGIGGLAFSLAAQSLVKNLISGVLIFVNRAFIEGDEIESQDGKLSGVVTKVGLINTKLMRLRGDPVVVPNAQLVDNSIVNVQCRDFWLIDHKLPLFMTSFAQLRQVVDAMDRTLKAKVSEVAVQGTSLRHINVYEEPVCYFAGFGHQGAEIRVRAYVNGRLNRHRFYEITSDILLALNDVALAFAGTAIGFEAHILSGPADSGHGHSGVGHGGHGHSHGREHGQTHKSGEEGTGAKIAEAAEAGEEADAEEVEEVEGAAQGKT